MKDNSKSLSKLVFERLSLYNRCIKNIMREGEKEYTDSSELSQILDVDSSLIRRDFSLIGKFGKRGMGYSLDSLRSGIEGFLGKDRTWKLALVGIGNLGKAVLQYLLKVESNYEVVRIFDRDRRKIGKKIEDKVIEDISELDDRSQIDIGIITVPADEAKKIANQFIDSKIKAIVNFAPIKLSVPESVYYREIDLIHEIDVVAGMIAFSEIKQKLD